MFQKIIYVKNQTTKKTILLNIKVILIIFLIVEFSSTFIFKFLNNSTENEFGVYFSPHKKNDQIQIFYKLGIIKSNQNTAENGYSANFKHKHQSKDFTINISYNEFGFRGKFPTIKKDSGEFRILCLGDSFVEGFGTVEDSTFPKLLQNHLHLENKKTIVINGGICGSSPNEEVKLYNNKLKIYNPDLIILEINNGDIEDFYNSTHHGKLSFNEYFYAISHVYRIFSSLNYIMELNNHLLANRIPPNVNVVIQKLVNFQKKLTKENKQLVIVYLPNKMELFSGDTTLFKRGLLRSKINFIDLQELYQKKLSSNKDSIQTYYWKNDGHHTPKGYNLMANTISEQLILSGNIIDK